MSSLRELSPGTVICLALGLVLVINAVLVLGLLRGGSQREIDLLRRAIGGVRSPWEKDDQAMNELRSRVSDLDQPEDANGDG